MDNSDGRNITILKKIVEYCDEIDATRLVLGNTKEALEGSFIYKNTAAMSVLQIGELASHLTTEFKNSHTDIPWREIIKMRNIAAHHYGEFRTDYLWDTITSDIDDLRVYCTKCLNAMESANNIEK
jgi:uncharacterized protein with HEPN domain